MTTGYRSEIEEPENLVPTLKLLGSMNDPFHCCISALKIGTALLNRFLMKSIEQEIPISALKSANPQNLILVD